MVFSSRRISWWGFCHELLKITSLESPTWKSLSLSLSFSAKNYLINHRPYTLLNLFLPMVLSPLNSFSYSLLDNTGGCFTFSEKNEFWWFAVIFKGSRLTRSSWRIQHSQRLQANQKKTLHINSISDKYLCYFLFRSTVEGAGSTDIALCVNQLTIPLTKWPSGWVCCFSSIFPPSISTDTHTSQNEISLTLSLIKLPSNYPSSRSKSFLYIFFFKQKKKCRFGPDIFN